ncbi:YozE family protein [Aerococcus urinaeequi]|uniref:YozE family protein n=1 Tax=Aerococcus urinaeequi TaxID=51665 RepID=UPI0008462765|nr:YozE family protein [Aerococcus urinaeequi]
MITQSFYHYVQIFRNADLLDSDQQAQFAELVFLDGDFPKPASDFETISNYIELNQRYSDYVSTFDEVWHSYADKYQV